MKVLHVVESFDNQAIESWLLQVLALVQSTHPHLHWTFFCIVGKVGSMDETAQRLGAEVILSPHDISDKKAFIQNLRRVMQQNRYDILHCHHDIMSALPLLAATGLPIRRRIVHVHNTAIGLPTPDPRKQALMRAPFRHICLRADRIVGVSEYALDAMLSGHQRKANRDRVIHCGIETQRFRRDENEANGLRRSFGFEPDAKVLLFVGRMIAYKNPNFLVEMLQHLREVDRSFAVVFAGTGPLENEVRTLAQKKNLQDHVKVLGWREDVPELMHACDALVWPGIEEPKEGLGLGIVEAQAAGLPVLMSRNVPEEAVVVPNLVRILSLDEGPQAWAQAMIALLKSGHPGRSEAWAQVEASPFEIARSAANIVALYEEDR